MRGPLAVVPLLLLAALAGCAGPEAEPAVEEAPASVPLSLIETGPAVGPDLEATTAAAPRLVVGEWWKIRFTGAFYTSEDLLRVVAAAGPDGYVFGMPHEGWVKEAIAYHAPAFGDVAADLSYSVHNERFTPVVFPLVQGATWETTFGGAPQVATVESADGHTATIRIAAPATDGSDPMTTLLCMTAPCQMDMVLTYDARLHEVVKMESPLGSWEVIAHGYDFRGWVTVPAGHHTAIDYGTFGPDPDHPLPSRTVEVDPSFNRITVLHAVFAVTPGAYRITSTAPDGQSFTTELVGPASSKFALFEVSDPGGTWTQEDLAVGVGGTYTMGIAYQQYDILVPEGDERPTHGHDVAR